ncbi:hypothetical protein NL108_018188 [Boleophthalmus pectinirostris]|uniref:interferon-induced protein 44-like n=1 Tax=Boleophthalmus pectinirostris TaxID=150288 RepID=UPI00242F9360|nr:interferon-induced protein 44-like [Boleophthalmus pectinirostris]KAJ0064068.1 hypothetical protein NL108_018188 [Boleophthalmus pectinirostris]
MGGGESTLLNQPWREINWRQKDDLLRFVKRFKPEGASHLRVLLYGPVGVGKSSFINTAISIITGRTYSGAGVETSTSATQSFTTTYRTYKIRSEGKKIPIVFNDIMGIEAGGGVGVRPDDIRLAMEGHVMDGYTFDQKNTISPEDGKYNGNPSIDDKVHVLVCILNANITEISPEVLVKMREIKEAARDLDIPQMAVATHIDQICPEIDKDVKNVYKSIALKKKMEYFTSKVGIPVNCIFPVRNNYEGPDREAVDVLFLTALKHIVEFGDDHLFNIYG